MQKPKGQQIQKSKNPGILAHAVLSEDSVVLPSDIYRERSESNVLLFDEYPYVPFLAVGTLEHFNALLTNSASAQSIINKLVQFTIGEGFFLKKHKTILGDTIAQELTQEQKQILHDVLTRRNAAGNSFIEELKNFTYNKIAFGNAFGEIIASMNGTMAYNKEVTFVRPKRTQDLIVRDFGVSMDWAIATYAPYYTWNKGQQKARSNGYTSLYETADVVEIPAYPVFDEEDRTIVHCSDYAPQMYFWGLPEWKGAKHWIELEYRIAKFNVSKFKNGLTPSGLLQLFGDLTPEEATQYIEDIQNKFTNTGNDWKVLVQVLQNPELKANFQSFEQVSQGYFMELATLCKEFISIGFGFPLSLMQATAGQLGGNQQLRAEFELLYNTKIEAIQQQVMQSFVKPYLESVASYEGHYWMKEIELGFKNIVPVSFKGDLDMNEIYTLDEKRAEFDLASLDTQSTQQVVTTDTTLVTEDTQTQAGSVIAMIKKLFRL